MTRSFISIKFVLANSSYYPLRPNDDDDEADYRQIFIYIYADDLFIAAIAYLARMLNAIF